MEFYDFIDPGGSQGPPAFAPGVAVRASMETGMNGPLTISVPEAGEKYLGLARNAAYDAAKRGEIPTIKIGRLLRVPVKAMEAMVGNDKVHQEQSRHEASGMNGTEESAVHGPVKIEALRNGGYLVSLCRRGPAEPITAFGAFEDLVFWMRENLKPNGG